MRTLKPILPSLQNRLVNASVFREQPLDQRGHALLSAEGISTSRLPSCLKHVEITALNAIYKGIGIRNVRGGMEFYSNELHGRPFTVRKTGITYIPRVEGYRSRTSCLFGDFLDYLSYLTLLDRHDTPLPEGDCIIMGSTRNFMDMLHESMLYTKAVCFFPFTQAGQTMFQTIKGERKEVTVDCSYIYRDMVSLRFHVKLSYKKWGTVNNGY